MFGFCSTLLCSWEVLVIAVGNALANGGTAGLFWNYIISAVGLGFVYASIAELGSMIPTSGGQYYWVAVLAPRRARRYLSYITGWLCAITWQTSIAGSAYFIGTLAQALFVLNVPNYDFKRWHGSLLAIGYLFIVVLFNTVLARRLPLLEGIFVIIHMLGIIIFIPLWILSPRSEGGSPLVDFYNPGGWSSNGVATLVGSVVPVTALLGFDCSVHMAEEARDSSRTVPVTLLLGYGTNVLLGFFALMTCIYTIGPLDQALQASTGYPIVNLFYNSTQSFAATAIMTLVLIVDFASGGIASLAAASRQLWAFARSRGVPYSHFFAPDHLPHDIPLNSVLFSLVIPIIIALVNIGSTEALGILLSLFNSALMASYGIIVGCVLIHRLRGGRLPHARYSLGKWGTLINTVALIYLAPLFIFSFFPPSPNPTAAGMNWACVMVGGIVLLATIYYIIIGRKSYTPPPETIEDYIGRAQVTTTEKEVSGGLAEESAEPEKKEM